MMKFIVPFLFLMVIHSGVFSQVNQWTIMGGDNTVPQYGIFGTKGTPGTGYRPGARLHAATWTDLAGNLWLFGGNGYTANGYGTLNDLWKLEPLSNQWTWVSGDNVIYQNAAYGVKGVASTNNKPGARSNAMTWVDSLGNLWMFGGWGTATNGSGDLNDLWKFTPTTGFWTWISGDTTINQQGIYRGASERINIPGGRGSGVTWSDREGNLWLFGGYGYAGNNRGFIADLWKYSPATNLWKWISGSNNVNQPAVRGTKNSGAATNQPGSRYGAIGWTDSLGQFWLFGGAGHDFSTIDYLSDTWKYNRDSNEWTWMSGDAVVNKPAVYGTKEISNTSNTPGGRQFCTTYTDSANNFWLFGGTGYTSGGKGLLNDVWKYNSVSNEWSWMSGDSALNKSGYFGTPGSEDLRNMPSARLAASGWVDKLGNLWFFGGSSNTNEFHSGNLNDLWRYRISTGIWTWMGGYNYQEQVGRYGMKGVSSPLNHPGGRYGATKWTDKEGNLWLFGGFGEASINMGKMNDLWKYTVSTDQWTWVTGDSTIYQPGNYGTKGITSDANTPGARLFGLGWTDNDGNLWLLGGNLYTTASDGVKSNDLWKFTPSTGLWTWINGTTEPNQPSVYGSRGVPGADIYPGSRQGAATWTDNLGYLYMFGGSGYSEIRGDDGTLSDLWKYDTYTNLWSWVGGNKGTEQKGVYGIKGRSSASNNPGARYQAIGWTDNARNLWLFGGNGYNANAGIATLNDLWKFNIATGQWTWVSGDNASSYPYGIYGTKNVAAITNKPGGREGALAFDDNNGNLWLFGGSGYAGGNVGSMNDLWKYNISSDLWTWISGDSLANDVGFYSTKGVPGAINRPGSRLEGTGWTDATGNFWLFGGFSGYQSAGRPYLNDLWRFSAIGVALPVSFTKFTARKQLEFINLNWSTSTESDNHYFVIERSANGIRFDSIGQVKTVGDAITTSSYSFIDRTPFSGANYYRLKQLDLNGKITYSLIAKVVMSEGIRFSIIRNPAQNLLELAVELPELQQLTLQVSDINGRLIISKDFPGKKGHAIYPLSIENLAKGSYFINLQTSGVNSSKIFIKQ